jgi:hypothetical protein
MKASIIVVFLVLLIAAVFVSDGVVQKKVVKTIPLQITSTEGANEQDEVEEKESIGTVYSDYYVGDSLVQPNTKGRYNEEFSGQKYVEAGGSNEQDGSSVPRVYEQEYLWDTGDMTDNFPQNVEVISELAPSTLVYVGGTTIPLSSYQTAFGKYLWIESNGLHQYISMPQYSSLPLIAYTSTGGPGEILEMYPSTSDQGAYQKTYYKFNPGYNRLLYRGEVAGRHYLLFSMGDQSSNAVVIDVDKE